MSKTSNGEPAFPVGSGDMRDPTGMTLRDYFAAKALHGLTASHREWAIDRYANRIAEIAYELADAMLRARGGK
jgi:hypothetical protein